MSDDNDTISTSDTVIEEVLDDLQTEAINACCDIANRIVSVTGSAGTGKTTILKKVYQRLVDMGYTVALCSPTGKAAKRIYEVTGIPATTIHRLLEYTHPGDIDTKTGKPVGISYPQRDRTNPLDYDVILADEYAMVTVEVHRSLLDAMKVGSAIRLFGDERQLAPIEEYSAHNKDSKIKEPSSFMKCLNEPRLKSVTLKNVYRQKEGSGILDNLHLILKQQLPRNNDEWFNKFTPQPIKELENYIFEHFDEFKFNSINNQIITPGNTTWVGTVKLNFILQKIYNEDDTDYIMIPRHDWDYGMFNTKGVEGGYIKLHVGDKVIYKANNLDLQVFNGETGIIKEFDKEYGEVVIDFGDREQAIPILMLKTNRWGKTVEFDPRKFIDLAYVITTHKAQGSQYDHVVYIMNKCDAWLLSNRNLYTACSRAKKSIYLITDQDSFTRAIRKRD